jgi:hypothetical protein
VGKFPGAIQAQYKRLLNGGCKYNGGGLEAIEGSGVGYFLYDTAFRDSIWEDCFREIHLSTTRFLPGLGAGTSGGSIALQISGKRAKPLIQKTAHEETTT